MKKKKVMKNCEPGSLVKGGRDRWFYKGAIWEGGTGCFVCCKGGGEKNNKKDVFFFTWMGVVIGRARGNAMTPCQRGGRTRPRL